MKILSNTSGVLHELLVAKHLHNSNIISYNNEKAEDALERLKNSIDNDIFCQLDEKAFFAATHLKTLLPGSISEVHWTSKPGNIEQATGIISTQSDDPSDLVLITEQNMNKIYCGISLKSVTRKKNVVMVSNPGLETTYGGKKLLEEHRVNILNDYPELETLPNAESRKEYMKQNVNMKNDVRRKNSKLLYDISANLYQRLTEMSDIELEQHIRIILAANKTPMQKLGHVHIQHSTFGLKGNYSYKVSDPGNDFEYLFEKNKTISIENRGTSMVFKCDDIQFAKHRIKFESQSDPLSTIKGSGEVFVNKKN